MIVILSYIATVWILASYLYIQKHPDKLFVLNIANFLGGIPLAVVEYQAKVWGPFVIGVSFALIGLYGLIKANKPLK